MHVKLNSIDALSFEQEYGPDVLVTFNTSAYPGQTAHISSELGPYYASLHSRECTLPGEAFSAALPSFSLVAFSVGEGGFRGRHG